METQHRVPHYYYVLRIHEDVTQPRDDTNTLLYCRTPCGGKFFQSLIIHLYSMTKKTLFIDRRELDEVYTKVTTGRHPRYCYAEILKLKLPHDDKLCRTLRMT
jgi:hypothetical protein